MDIKQLKELISLLEKSGIQRMTIKEKNGVEISLDKGGPAHIIQEVQPLSPRPNIPIAPQAQPFDHKETEERALEIDPTKCIKSPMVGTFYAAGSPETPPYVKVGDLINKGDTLCVIEAMKVMNEIQSDRQGKVKQILVENSSPVEYGQALFVIE